MKRRVLLGSACGAVLSGPLLSSLRPSTAQQLLTAPRRSIVFFTPNGCITDRWFPSIEDGTLQGVHLAGTTLEPLAPFAEHLLFPRGIRSLNAFGITQSIDAHSQAVGSKLTCAPLSEETEHFALGPSFDQLVAQQLNLRGIAPLVLRPGPLPTSSSELLSYSRAETPQFPQNSPLKLYAQLTDTQLPEAHQRVHRRNSILDAVREDLDHYRALPLGRSDLAMLEQWQELLRETELALPLCDPASSGINQTELEVASTEEVAQAFTAGVDTLFKLIAWTVACDLNRSVVFSFPRDPVFSWDDFSHTLDHASLGHRTGTSAVEGACVPNVVNQLLEIDGYYAERFAQLVELLGSLSEGDGQLLDNTATLWLPEFGDGRAHTLNNLPIAIAGSLGGKLKQAQVTNLEPEALGTGDSQASCAADGAAPLAGASTTGNVPINKLYVTLLDALGCRDPLGQPFRSFGAFDGDDIKAGITDPGPLSSLLA